MTRLLVILFWTCLLSCATKRIAYNPTPFFKGFQFFKYKDTINLTVDKFVKNDAYCATEALPYALIIGTTNNQKDIPRKISVLAWCDNNSYTIGHTLRILPIEDPTTKTTLNPLYLVRDSVVNGQRHRFLIGSDNPAIWGKVLK